MRLSTGAWVSIIFSTIFMLALIVISAKVWSYMPEGGMSGHGWAALALGVLLSVIIGGGLSAILIISRRRGYDEAAHYTWGQLDTGTDDDDNAR